LIKKGGRQLYIAIEKTGEESELLSVKKWSPLEDFNGSSRQNVDRNKLDEIEGLAPPY
jgi:hypothetical protein